MAGVTYLIRMLPFAFFQKKIKSVFVKSFLYYVPYAVLSAMTIPAIFYSTGNMITAVVGTVAAFVLAYFAAEGSLFDEPIALRTGEFRETCATCGSRLTCNGCSNCGACES